MAEKEKIYDYYEIAKPISYSGSRKKTDVLGIVIHNTGNENDSAKNNVLFFSKTYGSNTRAAGAHFFVDQQGKIGRSIPMNKNANAVGNPNNSYTHGTLYNTLNNRNTVSIELCDIMSKEPSEAMLASLDKLVAYIKRYCPNVKYICRHYDIVKKDCPHRFVKDEKAWHKLRARLEGFIK